MLRRCRHKRFLSTLSLRRATFALWMIASLLLFLSTLSLRRATKKKKINPANQNFYPRSPCGERLMQAMAHLMELLFLSTLSLRRATYIIGRAVDLHPFLSTLSLRRATYPLLFWGEQHGDFYPRSPCGERPSSVLMALPPYIFLSTLSLRRATPNFRGYIGGNIPFLSTLSLRRATG